MASCWLLLVLQSCTNSNDEGKAVRAASDTIKHDTLPIADAKAPMLPPPIVVPNVTYHMFHLRDEQNLKDLRAQYNLVELEIILAINRLDDNRMKIGDSLVVPDSLYDDLLSYSPFPASVPVLDGVSKMMLVSYPVQAFAAYEHGRLVRWGPVSLGKKSSPTPVGLFHTNWKSKQTISTINSEWILDWYFNLENFSGVSLHKYDLPGYPASHACVRLYEYDARWIYSWADQWILTADGMKIIAYGTPVIIYGVYNFGKPGPWKLLAENADTTKLTSDEAQKFIDPFISKIISRAAIRDSVISKKINNWPLP